MTKIALCVVLMVSLVALGCAKAVPPDKDERADHITKDEQQPADNAGETNDQTVGKDTAKYDQFTVELLAELLPTAFNLAVSPADNYLVFFVAAAPVSPPFIIDLATGEHERFGYSGQQLAEPGRVAFSPDGKKLAYSVFFHESQEGLICLNRAAVPPEIYHTFPLPKEHLLWDARPVWRADQSAVYYLTAAGLMEYRFADGKSREKYPISRLSGLVGKAGMVAPLAYSLQPEREKMAYFYDGMIRVVPLSEESKTPVEIKVVQSVSSLEFSPDGNYLVFDGGNWDDGLSLYKVNAAGGVIEEIARRVCSYAWGPAGELAVLAGRFEARELIVFDSAFQPKHKAKALQDSQRVLWIGDILALLTGGDHYYPLYAVNFE